MVSAFLGFLWVFTAWVYAEVIFHGKNAASLKARHSDANLAVMDNSSYKGEDQTMLLEGGQAAGAKPVYASFTSQMLRLFFMDQALLLENRLTLRAISEFGGHLLYFYICDRTHLLGESVKVKTIYVKNLPENASKEKIKELFERHGEVTKIVLPPAKAGHKRDFGFVHFAERSSALKAVKDQVH